MRKWILAIVLLGTAAPAGAHSIWIEQDGKAAKVYFGEFGDNLREVSPGLLDGFGKLAAWTQSRTIDTAAKALPLEKAANAFALSGRAGKGEALVAEDAAYPIFEDKEGAKTIRKAWTPAARWVGDFEARAPKLVLDVLPAGKAGELRVVFRDKPLAEAKVELIAPSGWKREAYTDAQGKVAFPLPWRGTYVVLVNHDEAKAGRRAGDAAYDAAAFTTTLSFTTRTGTAGLPTSPPAPPNK